jgi:hypothetical protein
LGPLDAVYPQDQQFHITDPYLPPDNGNKGQIPEGFLLTETRLCKMWSRNKTDKEKIAMSQAGDQTVTESKNSCLRQRN